MSPGCWGARSRCSTLPAERGAWEMGTAGVMGKCHNNGNSDGREVRLVCQRLWQKLRAAGFVHAFLTGAFGGGHCRWRFLCSQGCLRRGGPGEHRWGPCAAHPPGLASRPGQGPSQGLRGWHRPCGQGCLLQVFRGDLEAVDKEVRFALAGSRSLCAGRPESVQRLERGAPSCPSLSSEDWRLSGPQPHTGILHGSSAAFLTPDSSLLASR